MSADQAADPRANLLREMARAAAPGGPERGALMLGARCIDQQFVAPPPRPKRDPDYYRLEPGWERRPGDPGEPGFATAAVLTCCVTGRVLAGMGGPGPAIHPSVVGKTGGRADG